MASDKTVERRPYYVLVPMAILLVAFAGSAMWVTMNKSAVERMAEAEVESAALGDGDGDAPAAIAVAPPPAASPEPAEADGGAAIALAPRPASPANAPGGGETEAGVSSDDVGRTAAEADEAPTPPVQSPATSSAGDDDGNETLTVTNESAGRIKADDEITAIDEQPARPEETTAEAEAGAAGTDAGESAEEPAPVFDVVRIEPDGGGLVAGRAAPGAEVDILVGEEVVGRVTAASDGAFVAIIDAGRNADPQLVTARAAGDEVVEARASAPLIVVPQEGGAAPVIVSQDDAAPRIVQPAPRGPDEGVTLDAIRYGDDGRVVFAGRAVAGDVVRLYLDDALVGSTTVAADASWSARADAPVAPGVYRLRLDHVDETGAVATRIETPFQRQAIIAGLSDENRFIVQKGDSLWRIAENVYGEGARYTLIFGANSGAIRNPDLIYPGQVFALPGGASEGASDDQGAAETD